MTALYLSDLDGTLLDSHMRVSAYTAAVLREQIARGLLFSVCTARSPVGWQMTNLSDVPFNLPVCLMNGAMLYDSAEHRIVDTAPMAADTAAALLALCEQYGKHPLAYAVENGALVARYREPTGAWERKFVAERRGAFPAMFLPVDAYTPGETVYLSTQDTHEKLEPLRAAVDGVPGIAYVYYHDNYHEGNWYLEIFSDKAGKDNGLRRLKALTRADRVVAFGDNYNDLAMLKAADEALVVANGQEPVKAAAHRVLASNDEDGVAKYLAEIDG